MATLVEFIQANWGYIITGITSISVLILLTLIQRLFNKRDALNSRKDDWLKDHYIHLSEDMKLPFYVQLRHCNLIR